MLHVGVLPHHDRWGDVLHNLRYVIVDEAHVYRGVFGSHVANVLRRLRRLAAQVGRVHGVDLHAVDDRGGAALAAGHDGQQQAQDEERAAQDPGDAGEQVARATHGHQRVRAAAHQAAALRALQQHHDDEEEGDDDLDHQQQVQQHRISLSSAFGAVGRTHPAEMKRALYHRARSKAIASASHPANKGAGADR